MKKLKFNQANFAGAEVLSRAELKKVMGGSGSGDDCKGECDWDNPCPEENPVCDFYVETGPKCQGVTMTFCRK